MRLVLLFALVLLSALSGACNRSQEEEPTTPGALSHLIPEAPLVSPTPNPTPDLTGTLPPQPGGGGGGVADAGACGAPTPPAISRVNVKVLSRGASRTVLDATPLVGPDGDYCRQAGFTDGRLFCPVRPEGHPERQACESLRVGRAADTGRLGPTWSVNGRPCQGHREGASCQNHPDNQYLVFAYGAGTFRACAGGGACGQITLP
jgi:hypothetical protein